MVQKVVQFCESQVKQFVETLLTNYALAFNYWMSVTSDGTVNPDRRLKIAEAHGPNIETRTIRTEFGGI